MKLGPMGRVGLLLLLVMLVVFACDVAGKARHPQSPAPTPRPAPPSHTTVHAA